MNIYLIVRLTAGLSNLILIGVSLRAFWIKSPKFASLFPVLWIMESIADIIDWSHVNVNIKELTISIVIIAEILAYSYAFLHIIRSRLVKRIMILLISILLCGYCWVLFKRGYTNPALDLSDYFIFLIPAVAYFRELFKYPPRSDLLKDFTFWFVTSSLFIFASTIIARLTLFYLYIHINKVDHFFFDYHIVSGFVFIMVNILYIKSYLCLKRWTA